MRLLQVLILLFILTVSASVYAMSNYLPPVFVQAQPRPEAIKLNQESFNRVEIKSSAAGKRLKFLMDQRRFSRLLASSS